MKNYWNCKLPQNVSKTPDEMKSYLLENRVISVGGCWEWTKSLSHNGYGKIKWLGRKDLRVHRVAAHIWLSFDLSDTRVVCHHCDNPKCFNPKHLFIGTQSDNQKDSVIKKRHHLAKMTQCVHGHQFTAENTYISKSGARHCRSCHCANAMAAYRRRVAS